MSPGLQISGLPIFDHPESIREGAVRLVEAARAVQRTAAAVHVDWTHLVWSYNAPEQYQVLTAMNPPSDRALDLIEKAQVAEAALSAYADRLSELDAQRSALVLDILAFEEHRDRVEWENSRNGRLDNLSDFWREESVGLLHAEEDLNGQVAYLWEAKDRAENDCVNALGDLWGEPDFGLSGEMDVKSDYIYGQTRGAYVAWSRTGQAPWGRPAEWTEGDWMVKTQMLEDGAKDAVLEGGIFAADLAGWTTDGRTEAARSGLAQFGSDAGVLFTTPGIFTTSAEQKAESARRLWAGAVGATGYGTYRANGWHTVGTFVPDALLSVATGGTYLAPRAGVRGFLSSRHIPGGSPPIPSRFGPAVNTHAHQGVTGARQRLETLIDKHTSGLNGSPGPSPAFAGAPGLRLPQQTPPASLTRLNSAGESAGRSLDPLPWSAGSRLAGSSSTAHSVPPIVWENDFDPESLRADFPPEVAQATLPMIERARAVEPEVTADFLAALPENARPHGLEYRIKSPESLATKIDRKLAHLPPGVSAPPMNDVMRYTAVIGDESDLIPAATSIVDRVGERGWVVTSAQHSYVDGNPYKGIHCIVRSDELDMSVELQFHTDASIDVKERTHGAYEISRDPTRPPAERLAADTWLREQSAVLTDPPGLDAFDQLGGAEVRRITYAPDRT